jgi:hypothetical protein
MSGTGWGITLGIIYFVLLVVLGVLTFRKGHWVLGLIGFIFPILWIIGAMLPARYARRLWAGIAVALRSRIAPARKPSLDARLSPCRRGGSAAVVVRDRPGWCS